jgi:hypothetical protein
LVSLDESLSVRGSAIVAELPHKQLTLTIHLSHHDLDAAEDDHDVRNGVPASEGLPGR